MNDGENRFEVSRNCRGIINEQVFFIAEFHLGDHDVFTKDENGRKYPF